VVKRLSSADVKNSRVSPQGGNADIPENSDESDEKSDATSSDDSSASSISFDGEDETEDQLYAKI